MNKDILNQLIAELNAQGWQLVPKELTDDMWCAGRAEGTTDKAYTAMLAAAPKITEVE